MCVRARFKFELLGPQPLLFCSVTMKSKKKFFLKRGGGGGGGCVDCDILIHLPPMLALIVHDIIDTD